MRCQLAQVLRLNRLPYSKQNLVECNIQNYQWTKCKLSEMLAPVLYHKMQGLKSSPPKSRCEFSPKYNMS